MFDKHFPGNHRELMAACPLTSRVYPGLDIRDELESHAVSCEYEVPPGVHVPESLIVGRRVDFTRAARRPPSADMLAKCVNASYSAPECDRQYWSDRIDAWFAAVCAEVTAWELMQDAAPSTWSQDL